MTPALAEVLRLRGKQTEQRRLGAGVGCRAPSWWQSGELSTEPSPSRLRCSSDLRTGRRGIRGGQGLKNLPWGRLLGGMVGAVLGPGQALHTHPEALSPGAASLAPSS